MTGRWIILIVIIALGWGALELMLQQMKIGDYAQSPQHFEIPEGLTVLVGGGRAGVTFTDAPFLKSARFKVTCKGTEQRVQLKRDEVSETICDVRIKLWELMPGGKAAVEVSWGDESVVAAEAEPKGSETDGLGADGDEQAGEQVSAPESVEGEISQDGDTPPTDSAISEPKPVTPPSRNLKRQVPDSSN